MEKKIVSSLLKHNYLENYPFLSLEINTRLYMRYRNIFKPTVIASIVTLAAISFTSVTTSVTAQTSSVFDDERPNFVLILLDDMGYSDLGVFGNRWEDEETGENVTPTPFLDSLANEGVLLTNFHSGSICSPSRGMINTGVDNHRMGMATMIETLTDNQRGEPGYEGYLNDRVLPVARILQDSGYHTYMVGKWHLGGAEGASAGKLPGTKGFEKNYALLDGAGDFYSNRGISNKAQCVKYVENDDAVEELPNAPHYTCSEEEIGGRDVREIIEFPDNPIPASPEEGGFYATKFFTDKVMEFIDSDKDDGQPFFAFISYTAPHYPLQVPAEYRDKYIDRFMKGWDEIRTERFEKVKELLEKPNLVFPEHWPEPEPDGVQPWDSLTDKEKRQEATEAAIYVGMLDYLDEQVQRLVNHLKEIGEYEDTMIIFLSDNGGDAHDKDQVKRFQDWFVEINVDNDVDTGDLGGPLSWPTLGAGWAQIGMTPFWGQKTTQAEGGTRAAFFVHYPKINPGNDFEFGTEPLVPNLKENQYQAGNHTHAFVSVLDITPTILDYADIEHPGMSYNDRFIFPLDGKSMRPIWEGWQSNGIYRDNEAVAFEVKGLPDQALYLGDWKILKLQEPWGDKTWKLYNLADDPTELNDLSADPEQSERLAQMIAMYDEFEKDVRVMAAKAEDQNPEIAASRQKFTRPDTRIKLHADNVDSIPELAGIYEGVTFQRDEYVTSFKAGTEITAHVVWGQSDQGEEIFYAFKTEEEVLNNLHKITSKTLNKKSIKSLSQLPMVFDGIFFRPDEYMTYFDLGLAIDLFLAVEQRYGYPVVHAFLSKNKLVDFYEAAQDKRCASMSQSAYIVAEKTASPLKVEVYLSPTEISSYVNSMLIYGETDAILVGSQNSLGEGRNVAEWIKEVAPGRELKTIWVSHAHPNRYFGVDAILESFPNAQVYATPGVVQEIREYGPGNLPQAQNKYGVDDAPERIFVPDVYRKDYLTVEGECIEIMKFSEIDGMKNYTALYMPGNQTIFVADIATRGGHALMAIGEPPYQSWLDAIDMIKTMKPEQVITGNAAPAFENDRGIEVLDETRTYIETFTSIVNETATMEEAKTTLEAKYSDYILPDILDFWSLSSLF
ncbi:arylsulfatase [Beggiatoa sp. PS]|nr:arylsulfatase [Beggiatoa sp. PS]